MVREHSLRQGGIDSLTRFFSSIKGALIMAVESMETIVAPSRSRLSLFVALLIASMINY